MSDPLGLIGNLGGPRPDMPRPTPPTAPPDVSFKQMLSDQIAQVNELQQDAKEATEDIIAGRRDDLETVMVATQKADTAFQMLLAVRNKVMDAYDEVKQIRI